jgi:hypothetical protein
METKKPILFTFPSSAGDYGRYEIENQQFYFSKFPGGVINFVIVAVDHRLHGDLISFMNACEEVFDRCYSEISQLITDEHYSLDKREFSRRCFDIWRYVTTLFHQTDYQSYNIDQVLENHSAQRVTFLLK